MRSEDEYVVVAALAAKYPLFAEATIRRWVAREAARYANATIQTYVPLLVQRSVDATLTELARSEGTSTDLLSISQLAEPVRTLVLPELAFWPPSKSTQTGCGCPPPVQLTAGSETTCAKNSSITATMALKSSRFLGFIT